MEIAPLPEATDWGIILLPLHFIILFRLNRPVDSFHRRSHRVWCPSSITRLILVGGRLMQIVAESSL